MRSDVVKGVVLLPLMLLTLLPGIALTHETTTTTVLFDREIVRILDKHCVMCHVANGPSFPLSTYEETWLRGRQIRTEVLKRHMPPWGAVPGYGEFLNDNGLTLRETQFMVSWVEGLGPRNAGTVFANVVDPTAKPRQQVRAHVDFGYWQLGEPGLKRELAANTIEPGQGNVIRRTVIDLGLSSERRVRGIEYLPGDRRVVRAAFFTVQETGQWVGSWTPWYGFATLPAGAAYRLPAGSHIVAEIHFRGTNERVVDRGTLGLFFADQPVRSLVSDLALEAKGNVMPRATSQKFRAETRIAADTYALALRLEVGEGIKSIEVSARRPDGGTEILLFAKDLQLDWPTPYIFKEPVILRRGTQIAVTAYYANDTAGEKPGGIRLTMSQRAAR